MEVRASSTYDFKATQALIRRNMSGKSDPRKSLLVKLVIFFVTELIFIGLLYQFGYNKLIVMCIVLYLALILLHLYMYFILPKIQYKNMCDMIEMKNEYIFTDECMKIKTISAKYNGEAELKYEHLYKVIDDSQYFFIFQTKVQVFLVQKDTINQEECGLLQEKFKEQFGKKYIVCKQ